MQTGLLAHIKARCELAKLPLCLFIGCATLFGVMMADPAKPLPAPLLLLVPLGIFLVAAGAASLNGLQEQQADGRMTRTRHRPLPTGRLSRSQACRQAVFLLLFGLSTVAGGSGGVLPVSMTIGAVLLYNGMYTPLKQLTLLAIVPGAVCGALPVVIGWLAGGGSVGSDLLLLVVLFVLWQVPHFWLVQLAYPQDYADGRVPNLLHQLSESGVKRLLITWIVALSLTMLMFAVLPDAPFFAGKAVRLAVTANSLLLPAIFFYGLVLRQNASYRFLFVVLNCSLLLHMIVLCGGRLAGG